MAAEQINSEDLRSGEVGTIENATIVNGFLDAGPRYVELTNLAPADGTYAIGSLLYVAIGEVATVQPLTNGGSYIGLKNRCFYYVEEDHLTVLQLITGDDDLQYIENEN